MTSCQTSLLCCPLLSLCEPPTVTEKSSLSAVSSHIFIPSDVNRRGHATSVLVQKPPSLPMDTDIPTTEPGRSQSPGHLFLLGPVGHRGGGRRPAPPVRGALPPAEPGAPLRAACSRWPWAAHVRKGPVMTGRSPSCRAHPHPV